MTCCVRADVAEGSESDMTSFYFNVRFTPKSGHPSPQSRCPLKYEFRILNSILMGRAKCALIFPVSSEKQSFIRRMKSRPGRFLVSHTGRSHMQKFLTTLAVLSFVATPAFAQSHGAPVTGTESNQEENHFGYYASNFGSQNDRKSGFNAFAMVPHAQSWLRGRSSSHGWW
jgi:hypothetical protein